MSKQLVLFLTAFALLTVLFSLRNQTAQADTDDVVTIEEVDDEVWVGVTPISTGPFGGKRPAVAAAPNGDSVIVAYLRQMSDLNVDDQDTVAYFRKSSNRGETWSAPAPIGLNGPEEVLAVDLVFDGNNQAHAVWSTLDEPTLSLYYAKESQWPTTPATPFSTVDDGLIINPAITARNNLIVAVWAESESGDPFTDIYFRRSFTNGDSWSAKDKVASTGNLSREPGVGVDNNNRLHVVWQEGQFPLPTTILYSYGIPGGGYTWSTPTIIASGSGSNVILSPQLTMHNNEVKVSFTRWNDINLNQSQNVEFTSCNIDVEDCTLGANWTPQPAVPISGSVLGETDDNPFSVKSTIVSAGSCAHVYFHGIPPGLTNQQIFGANQCEGWSTSGRDVVTAQSSASTNPKAATYNGLVYIAYEDVAPGGEPRLRTIWFVQNDLSIFLPILGN